MNDEPSRLSLLDLGGVTWAAAMFVVVACLEVFWVPHFEAMFADFGSALPTLTKVALTRSVMFPLAMAPVLLPVAGLVLRLERSARLALVVVSAVWALASVLFIVFAVYLPIFELAPQLT